MDSASRRIQRFGKNVKASSLYKNSIIKDLSLGLITLFWYGKFWNSYVRRIFSLTSGFMKLTPSHFKPWRHHGNIFGMNTVLRFYICLRHKPGSESIDAFESDSRITSFNLIRFIDELHHLINVWFLTFSEIKRSSTLLMIKKYKTSCVSRYFFTREGKIFR